MRKNLVTVFSVVIFCLTYGMFTAGPAAATAPAAITISLIRDPDLNPSGWSATGAVADSGSWTADNGHLGALTSPKTGTVHLLTTETGTSGTFRIKFEGMFDPNTGSFGGDWVIQDGTGGYANLHGQGKWARTIATDGHLIFTCSGRASIR